MSESYCRKYRVEVTDGLYTDKDGKVVLYNGMIEHVSKTICISSKITKTRQMVALVHELLHAFYGYKIVDHDRIVPLAALLVSLSQTTKRLNGLVVIDENEHPIEVHINAKKGMTVKQAITKMLEIDMYMNKLSFRDADERCFLVSLLEQISTYRMPKEVTLCW